MVVLSAQTVKTILEGIIAPKMYDVKDRLAAIEGRSESVDSEIIKVG
jgi:hypothetical protein